MNKPIRILLSETASKHLETMGQDCFAVVAMDKSDEHSGRMILHLVPCSYNLANAAVRVAMGKSTEKRPKPPVVSSSVPLTQAETRSA